MAVVLLVAIVSIALTVQGWRSRVPAFDLLTYIHGTRNFLDSGAVLQHGDTGSYGSYKPPGTAWLMLPSAMLFADPRLSEYVGTALLHLSTLVGLYLLARRYFSLWCACLAVVLYGLSTHGLFLAGSLWPNGRPDFYVWVAFFTSEWVVRRRARYLAMALAVWGFGMQVDMGITPAFFLMPAAWLYYRPPVRPGALLVASALVLIVWSPYLRFEASRGFADVRSQLLQQSVFPGNYRDAWCNPDVPLGTSMEVSSGSQSKLTHIETPPGGGWDRLVSWERKAEEKALSNYEQAAPAPGSSYVLLVLTLGSLLILSVPGFSPSAVELTHGRDRRSKLLGRLAAFMVLGGALATGIGLAADAFGRETIWPGSTIAILPRLGKILVLGGVALVAGSWLGAGANLLLVRAGVHIQTRERAEGTRLLAFALLVPWVILLVVAEPGKPERYWWLWPLQSLFLAAFLTNVLPRLRVPRAAIWAGQMLIILVVVGNSFLLTRVDSWVRAGWAGQDAEEIQIVDYVARQIEAEGMDRAAIGYNIFVYPFMASYNITNPIYKVGAEFDLLLLYQHRIVNTNQCAEGVAGDDEYRIVETRPKPPDWSPRDYFVAPAEGDFHLLTQIGSYQVYKRD